MEKIKNLHQQKNYIARLIIKLVKQSILEMNSELKKFTFYFKTASQEISLATGTPQNQIIETLKIVFGIDKDKKLLFLGEEGGPIILSSALPDATKLTILDEDYKIATISSPSPLIKGQRWKWVKISGGNLINNFQFEVPSQSKATFYGDIKITSGKHWWKIQLKEVHCCQDTGITKQTIKEGFWKSKTEDYNRTIGFPDVFPGQTTGPGYTSCSTSLKWDNHIYIFYLDMDAGQFTIFNQNLNRLLNHVKVVFTPAVPFFHSNKHKNNIKLLEVGQGPLEQCWMKQIAKNKK